MRPKSAGYGWLIVVLIVGVFGGVITARTIEQRSDLERYQSAAQTLAADVDVLRSQLIGVGEEPAAPSPDERDVEAGPAGDAGRDGIDGKDGARGPAGDDGVDGEDGAPGPAGSNGTNGVDGINGDPGAPGLNGTNGTDGAPGPQGPAGETGPTGPQGPEGPMPDSWTWIDGDLVRRCDLTAPSTYTCTPVVP